jgi:protein-S-isoprenylcysteine O-methyltransferase
MSGLDDIANTPDVRPATNGTHNLETLPVAARVDDGAFPPNTPLAASTTSFILGSVFSVGLYLVLTNSNVLNTFVHPASWKDVAFTQPSVQLSFFMAAWAFFHWAEFAVTAGWNREKCSTHCELSTPFKSRYFQLNLLD